VSAPCDERLAQRGEPLSDDVDEHQLAQMAKHDFATGPPFLRFGNRKLHERANGSTHPIADMNDPRQRGQQGIERSASHPRYPQTR
jgi:hypothetical protein